jgi:hypothetical protein
MNLQYCRKILCCEPAHDKESLSCTFYEMHVKQIALSCVFHVVHDKDSLSCADLKTHGKDGSSSAEGTDGQNASNHPTLV